MKLELGEIGTPLGVLRFARASERIFGLAFAEVWPALERAVAGRLGRLELCAARGAEDLRARLDAFFAGDLATLDGVELALLGTEFQLRVWSALRSVPAGATISYGALARAIGAGSAVRAVGAANGANPVWLIVPCHRAIGADGRLVGYAGGIERKRWLLAHESRCSAQVSSSAGVAQRAVQNSEKRPHSSGPSGVVEIFVPGGTATGLPASKR